MPVKTGIRVCFRGNEGLIPAFAGMTEESQPVQTSRLERELLSSLVNKEVGSR